MTDLQFGMNVPTSAADGADPLGLARAAEDLGFDFVSSNDHPCGDRPTFETWTLLAWIAAGTSRIRVATRVLGLPYRHPPMVAKMAESLDRLSRGRLILGMGGGYADDEFRAFGLGVPTAREKMQGLEEALRIMRGLWSERGFSFDGERYRTDRADIEPKPGHAIPIWLGTLGPRGLALAGRLADGWIPSLELAPPERAVEMRARILDAAAEAGRDPAEITCAYNLDIRVGRADPEPGLVSGSVEAVTATLLGFVELGFTAFNVSPVGPGEEEQRGLLAGEVIPAVRAGAA